MREVVIEETDNDDREVVDCYICGWTLPIKNSIARAGVHICPGCDDEFDQILVEDL